MSLSKRILIVPQNMLGMLFDVNDAVYFSRRESEHFSTHSHTIPRITGKNCRLFSSTLSLLKPHSFLSMVQLFFALTFPAGSILEARRKVTCIRIVNRPTATILAVCLCCWAIRPKCTITHFILDQKKTLVFDTLHMPARLGREWLRLLPSHTEREQIIWKTSSERKHVSKQIVKWCEQYHWNPISYSHYYGWWWWRGVATFIPIRFHDWHFVCRGIRLTAPLQIPIW